jgi:hypothetical protein
LAAGLKILDLLLYVEMCARGCVEQRQLPLIFHGCSKINQSDAILKWIKHINKVRNCLFECVDLACASSGLSGH